MAETRLTDVIVPDIFTDYTLEPSIKNSRFWRSGIIQPNGGLRALLNGGGKIFQMPFFQNPTNTTGVSQIPDETTPSTVNNVLTGQQDARRQLREQLWGSNNLVTVLTGADPMGAVATAVNDYWANDYDLALISSVVGVIADNIANDSGDLLEDQSGSSIDDDMIVDAQNLLGENGVLGRSDQNGGQWAGIAMHSAIYNSLRKQDAITFVAISGQDRPIEFYQRMVVIVDDNLPVNTNVYDTVLFKTGAFNFDVGTSGYTPTETDRQTKVGFGIDELITRRVFGLHPVGFQWSDGSVAGESPTNAELELAANWNRAFEQQNTGFVMLRSLV